MIFNFLKRQSRIDYDIVPSAEGWRVSCGEVIGPPYAEQSDAIKDTLSIAAQLKAKGERVAVRLLELDGPRKVWRALELRDAPLSRNRSNIYNLGVRPMATANHQPLPNLSQKSAEAAQALHDDIRTRWSKFSDFEIGALKDNNDLITQVASRYTLDREQAQGDVAALLKGRQV